MMKKLQAYEQVSDAKQTMANLVGNFMDNNYVMYTAPALEFMGAGIQAHLGYALQASDSGAPDGGQAAYSPTFGKGYEAGVTVTYEGLKVGVYGAERENTTPNASTGQQISDEFNGAWYAKYTMGPVSIGYSETYMDAGVTQALSSEKTTFLKLREQLVVSLQVSNVNCVQRKRQYVIPYITSEETYDTQDHAATAVTTDDDVTEEIDAIQVAYSMGGMSIKAYNMEVTT